MENLHDAFADPEQRYRRRYVDLTVNDHVKKRLLNAQII
jgi:lysyl-tRNA synthetase class 2